MSSSLSSTSSEESLGFGKLSGDPDADLLGEVPETLLSILIPWISALNPDFYSRLSSSKREFALSRCISVFVTSYFGGVLSG
jgi:hypothetical protein